MLKEIYRKLYKIKYLLFGKFYKPSNLPTAESARAFLESTYNKSGRVTDYNEKYLYKPNIDLSIIIPVYGAEEFLKRCVESCIQQTKFSYEIILVDDESPDKSGEICDSFAKQYDFIKVFHIKNSGVSFARNYGLVRSKGRYVMFIDSDDYAEKDCIENLLKEADGFDIVQGRYNKIDKTIYYKSKVIEPKNLENFSKEYGYSWGKIFKREIYENLKFPIGFWFEDMINNVVINPTYKKYKMVDTFVYNYVLNRKGITSSSKKSLKILDTFFVLEEIVSNFDTFKIEFSTEHYKRFLFEASYQTFMRLRRYDEKFMKNVFVLLCELNTKLMQKHNIKKEGLSKLDRTLVECFNSKNYKKWKNIAVFYN